MPADAPIQREYRKIMNDLAVALDAMLNPQAPAARETGFALLMFPFDALPDDTRVNYISNTSRDQMEGMMKTLLKRWEAARTPRG